MQQQQYMNKYVKDETLLVQIRNQNCGSAKQVVHVLVQTFYKNPLESNLTAQWCKVVVIILINPGLKLQRM